MNIISNIWKLSSVGRASALQAGGRRFESYSFHQKKKSRERNQTRLNICGNGSVVERCLAKADVASSNLVSRSNKRVAGGRQFCLPLVINKYFADKVIVAT